MRRECDLHFVAVQWLLDDNDHHISSSLSTFQAQPLSARGAAAAAPAVADSVSASAQAPVERSAATPPFHSPAAAPRALIVSSSPAPASAMVAVLSS